MDGRIIACGREFGVRHNYSGKTKRAADFEVRADEQRGQHQDERENWKRGWE